MNPQKRLKNARNAPNYKKLYDIIGWPEQRNWQNKIRNLSFGHAEKDTALIRPPTVCLIDITQTIV